MGGYCGAALFYAYYYRLTGRKSYLQKMNAIILKCLEAISEKELLLSHCNGIGGIAWCIQHLIKNDFISAAEFDDVFVEVDLLLSGYMKNELEEKRYDFLHEGLGIILYFLERMPDDNARIYLEQAVEILENSSISTPGGITWSYRSSQKIEEAKDGDIYNIGLAHGMPAIVSILTMMYEKGIAKDKTSALVNQGLQWLMANRDASANNGSSLYPSLVTADNQPIGQKHSRLGWCYGDLGIAVTLWNAGRQLDNSNYINEAYSIYEYTLQHRDRKNGTIVDASLCHGSMGISHMYRRAASVSGDQVLKAGMNKWLDETLDMARGQDGTPGYQYRTNNGFENNGNLLEGKTGIGLGLIAALDEDIVPAWDKCLLLS